MASDGPNKTISNDGFGCSYNIKEIRALDRTKVNKKNVKKIVIVDDQFNSNKCDWKLEKAKWKFNTNCNAGNE